MRPILPEAVLSLVEPSALLVEADGRDIDPQALALVSLAISMRRIADAVEKLVGAGDATVQGLT